MTKQAKANLIQNNLCIRRSSIFNNPKFLYNMFIYKKVLEEHGAYNFRQDHYLGQSNLPNVLIFDGLSSTSAQFILRYLPEFKKWGCIIDKVDWGLEHAITIT